MTVPDGIATHEEQSGAGDILFQEICALDARQREAARAQSLPPAVAGLNLDVHFSLQRILGD